MIKKGIIFPLLLLGHLVYSQSQVIDKITLDVCNSIQEIETPLEDLSNSESLKLVQSGILKHSEQWLKELEAYTKNTRQGTYKFDQYLQHYISAYCPESRVLLSKFDRYLDNKPKLRKLYLQSKKLIFALEDGGNFKDLFQLLKPNSKTSELIELLNTATNEIQAIKPTTCLSNILVYENGYTFRVRYADYKTGLDIFQIDIVFADDSDTLIDNLTIKKRAQLVKEHKSRKEVNQKVERGEVKIPAPPPSPKKKKGN